MAEKEKLLEEEKNDVLFDVKNIKTSETYTLPSKGLLYSEEDNIPASITLRRMTTKEDKIRMRNQSEDTIRKDILQACITNNGVDAGKLKLMDANFLLFRLRSLSLLNDTYKVKCICNSCGANFVHEVNLSEVPIKYYTKTNLKDLKINLPISQHTITLKYPSLNDIIRKGADLKNYFAKFPNADRAEAIYTMGALLYIDKINSKVLLPEELEDYIDNLDILDNRVLRDTITKIDDIYGFDTNLKCFCPNCHNEVSHGLPITGELFNPSL